MKWEIVQTGFLANKSHGVSRGVCVQDSSPIFEHYQQLL